MGRSGIALAAIIGLTGLVGSASADERLFTYTYEPTTMPQGTREVEQWLTARLGKASGDYVRFDLRTEIEFGLLDNLQTALYLNFKSVRSKGVPVDGTFSDEEEFEFEGISSEWMMKFLDPVADPIGVAGYMEVSAGAEEIELEEKLILGKVIGPWNLALNVVFEEEWELEREGLSTDPANPDAGDREVEREFSLEFDAGISYLFRSFAVGLEFRNHNDFPDYEKLDHSAFFLGPVFHLRQKGWWATLTILPQIGAYRPTDHGLVLDEHERLEARLLVGVDF